MIKLKLIGLTVLLLTLTGCMSQRASMHQFIKHSHDWIDVYSPSGKKIKTLTSKKTIDYFSDKIGDGAGNATKHHVSRNSKLKFKYVIHQKRRNHKFSCYVYTNRQAKAVMGTTFPAQAWKLTNQEFAVFDKPQKLQ